MAFFVQEELIGFLYAVIFGAMLGIVYDFFRIIRNVIRHNVAAVSTEDVIFWIGTAVSSFMAVLFFNDGILRMYMILGGLAGCIIYRFTLSRLLVPGISFFSRKYWKYSVFY